MQIGSITLPQFGFSSLDQAVATFLPIIYVATGLAAFFFILWGGILYIMSGGDEKKSDGARRTIVNAVIGLVMLGLAGIFWQLLITTFLPNLAPYYGF